MVIKKDLITHIVLYLTIQNERTHLHNYGALIFRKCAFFNLVSTPFAECTLQIPLQRRGGRPYPEVTVAVLPSSLAKGLS